MGDSMACCFCAVWQIYACVQEGLSAPLLKLVFALMPYWAALMPCWFLFAPICGYRLTVAGAKWSTTPAGEEVQPVICLP